MKCSTVLHSSFPLSLGDASIFGDFGLTDTLAFGDGRSAGESEGGTGGGAGSGVGAGACVSAPSTRVAGALASLRASLRCTRLRSPRGSTVRTLAPGVFGFEALGAARGCISGGRPQRGRGIFEREESSSASLAAKILVSVMRQWQGSRVQEHEGEMPNAAI